jgi:predicted MPP superfamily phosphohydrolase
MTQRRVGLASARQVTAAEQLQKSFPQAGIQPLPPGRGGRAKAADVGIKDADPLTFFVIGDHGGIKAPSPQNAVTYAMERAGGPHPDFVYSVGDVVYFNGDASEYGPQFYEAYGHLLTPIVAIPGNHDGDTTDDPSRPPLDTFMANFCDKTPSIPAADPQFEFNRHTQTQPYCDWTLELQSLTIVGLYTNVPSGGHLEQSQIDWLTGELKAAASDRPLMVTLHHPPLSVDAHHGGSQHMGDALDQAFAAAGRTPELVVSGHVHDAQFFTRDINGKHVPYLVIGNSGYHNLHQLAADAQPGQQVVPGVTFEYGDASEWGFLSLTVAGGKITGEYTGVTPGVKPDGSDATVTPGKHQFST